MLAQRRQRPNRTVGAARHRDVVIDQASRPVQPGVDFGRDLGDVFFSIPAHEARLGDDYAAAGSQLFQKRWGTQRTVFDPVAVIRPRQPLLGLLNRIERQADGGFFNGVEGQLKTVLMRPPDQLSEHVMALDRGRPGSRAA